jgi:hypothetical protein
MKKRGNVPPRLLTLEENKVSMWVKMKERGKTYVARRVM